MAAQLLKEQNKYDKIPSGILDRLRRILPLANEVADEIVCEETDILEKTIPRMFEVMHRVARFLYDYVKYGRNSSCRTLHGLMIDNRRAGLPGENRRNGHRAYRGD